MVRGNARALKKGRGEQNMADDADKKMRPDWKCREKATMPTQASIWKRQQARNIPHVDAKNRQIS